MTVFTFESTRSFFVLLLVLRAVQFLLYGEHILFGGGDAKSQQPTSLPATKPCSLTPPMPLVTVDDDVYTFYYLDDVDEDEGKGDKKIRENVDKTLEEEDDDVYTFLEDAEEDEDKDDDDEKIWENIEEALEEDKEEEYWKNKDRFVRRAPRYFLRGSE
eukprot:scaffold2484_cov159-Ochromonas_danica.AAC.2